MPETSAPLAGAESGGDIQADLRARLAAVREQRAAAGVGPDAASGAGAGQGGGGMGMGGGMGGGGGGMGQGRRGMGGGAGMPGDTFQLGGRVQQPASPWAGGGAGGPALAARRAQRQGGGPGGMGQMAGVGEVGSEQRARRANALMGGASDSDDPVTAGRKILEQLTGRMGGDAADGNPKPLAVALQGITRGYDALQKEVDRLRQELASKG